jgi:hypothetical protein
MQVEISILFGLSLWIILLLLVCLFLRIAMLLYQPNLGKTCPTIFLSLMPLVSSYLSKAYQLNLVIVFPCI